MGIKTPYTTYCASKVLLVSEKGGFLNFLSFSLPLTCFFQSAAWFLWAAQTSDQMGFSGY